MSTRPTPSPLDLPIRCFSQLSNTRCQGLSGTYQIASYIPVALLVIVLPFLLISTYRLPRATLLLLAIEIVLHLGVNSWNLAYFLDRPSLPNFKTTDTALASATPILIYLLALTSHLLSDIRSHLPFSLQGRVSSVMFAVLVAPLIPVAYVASLVGGFAFVRHRSLRAQVFLDFGDIKEDWLNLVLTSIGTISALAYILLISLLALIPLLHPPSTFAYLTTTPSLRPFALSTLAIILSAGEIAMGLIPLDSISPAAAGAIILVRSCLLLLSRTGLAAGLISAYKETEALRKRKSGIFVGGPLRGTFRKLDESGTREFYGVHGLARGGVVPPERVILRPPGLHAPKLSFTSSAFVAFGPPTPLRAHHSPTVHSPAQAQAEKARKNLGSIYAPKRVTVDPLSLAQWPPPPVRPRPESSTLPLSSTSIPHTGQPNPFDNPPVTAGSHQSVKAQVYTMSPSPPPSPTPRPESTLESTLVSHPLPSASGPSAYLTRGNSSRRKPVPSPHRLSPPSTANTSTPASRAYHPRQTSAGTERTSFSSYAPSSTVDNRRTLFYATPLSSPTTSPTKPSGPGEFLAPHPGSFELDRGGREVSWGQVPESATLPPRDSAQSLGVGSYYGEGGSQAVLASLARLRRETGLPIDLDRLNRQSGMSMLSTSGLSTAVTMGDSQSGRSGGSGEAELRGLAGGGWAPGTGEGVRRSLGSEGEETITPRAEVVGLPSGVEGPGRREGREGRGAWWADARI